MLRKSCEFCAASCVRPFGMTWRATSVISDTRRPGISLKNTRLPKSQPASSVPMTEYVAASQAACFLHSLSCATDVPCRESDLPVVPSPGKVRILWKLNVTSLSCPASPTCHSEFVTVDREQS